MMARGIMFSGDSTPRRRRRRVDESPLKQDALFVFKLHLRKMFQ